VKRSKQEVLDDSNISPGRLEPCSGNLETLYESGNGGLNATQNVFTLSWDT